MRNTEYVTLPVATSSVYTWRERPPPDDPDEHNRNDPLSQLSNSAAITLSHEQLQRDDVKSYHTSHSQPG